MGNQTNIIGDLGNRISSPKGDNKKRLTLGPDFILSHSVSGTARLPYGQPGSPGFTSRSDFIIAQSSRLQQAIKKTERLTLGLDFNISRRIPTEARLFSEQPRSPGFTIPLCTYCSISRLQVYNNNQTAATQAQIYFYQQEWKRDAALTWRFAGVKGDKNFSCFSYPSPISLLLFKTPMQRGNP
jgi:hypothetical protein